MDKLKIDGEKISLHPQRVVRWLDVQGEWGRAKGVYPIYVEISPIGICNHRCTFCAVDYIGYPHRQLEPEIMKQRLTEMRELGVRSVMYAGEGEPLLYKPLASLIIHSAKSSLDVAVTTNAVALTEDFCHEALPHIKWIKASVNAGRAETYAKIHRTNPKDFDKAIRNMRRAAEIRKAKGLTSCHLGIQMVLLPENAQEAVELARLGKEIGIDYVVIKPYSQHLKGISRLYEGVDYSPYYDLEGRLAELNDDRFHVVFRARTMKKLNDGRSYSICQATPFFWAYIMSNGDLYGCSAYLEDPRFCYGSIHQQTFREVWEGEKRRENFMYVEQQLDIAECRQNCRMDEVNRYLWSVKHPPEHASFI